MAKPERALLPAEQSAIWPTDQSGALTASRCRASGPARILWPVLPGRSHTLDPPVDGSVTLVRQLREATRKHLLELPAGTAEPGEEPLETARRELREECGLTGGKWRQLAAFWTTPGFCRERMHLFAAEGVERGELEPADDEELELVRWPARRSP